MVKDVCVLVGAKKGAFFITGNAARDPWRVQGPAFFGYIVHHMIADPRDRNTLLIAARTDGVSLQRQGALLARSGPPARFCGR
ncbi:MAG: hypothetical protein O7C67_01625 [Gammaproteobacteria bacterium]|nr:hypothetical protein [Gammaproteobacteria bacterium]